MEIILPCKQCDSTPCIEKDYQNYSLSCCSTESTHRDYEQTIKEWNELNNEYTYIFGVYINVNEDTEEIVKSLDGMTYFDKIIQFQAIYANQFSDKPFNKTRSELFELFPELQVFSQALTGLQIRKATNDFELYSIKFDFKANRQIIESYINSLSIKELKKYKWKGGRKIQNDEFQIN